MHNIDYKFLIPSLISKIGHQDRQNERSEVMVYLESNQNSDFSIVKKVTIRKSAKSAKVQFALFNIL
jgi:hypothetical protein